MERGRRLDGLAVGCAVFLSGAALLGVEIAASRVLAPTFGSSLYVWGALIGVVLTGLSIGYWAGGALADRWPSPYLFVGAIALGAGLVLAIPVVDEWVLEQVVTWDPGPRLDPLVAAIILFGPMSVVLASVSPIAVRLAARSLDRLGTVAGRLFSISTAGSIAGTFVTAFWLVPEYGTDQVLAVGALVLLAAAASVALLQRLWIPGAALVVAAGAALLAVGALSPDTTGRVVRGAAAQNWSPLYRERDVRTPRKLDPAEVALSGSGFTVREATRHALPPPLRDGRRELAVPPLRQLVPERHVPRRPGADPVLLQRLPAPRSRVQPEREADPHRRPRRRLDARSGSSATSRTSRSRPSSSTRRSSRPPTSGSSCRGARASSSRWTTVAGSCSDTTTATT